MYKKYIRKNGKLHGPYYYESYRDGDTVKKRYLGARKSYFVQAVIAPLFFSFLSEAITLLLEELSMIMFLLFRKSLLRARANLPVMPLFQLMQAQRLFQEAHRLKYRCLQSQRR